MSSFGPFVTAGTGEDWGMPGCEAGLSDAFVTWLDELCTELGCVNVPVGLLLEPYDGPSALEHEDFPEEVLAAFAREAGHEGEEDEEEEEGEEGGEEEELSPAWWDRYFQYV